MSSKINAERLWNRLEALARITDPDRPYTRRSFSPLHIEGRSWLRDEFTAAGLSVSLDTAANLIGRREGTGKGLPPILAGSHSDSVPDGGRFDGMAGLLSALEAAQSLKDNGVTLRHPLEVVDFLAEEPSIFGMSCIGSRIMGGHLTRENLGITEPGGETLADAIRRMGGDPDRLDEAVRPAGSVAAYAELHIEQGLRLQNANIPIGIVTGIVGITRYSVTIEGRADHSGNTPMDLRVDALAAAARLVLRVEQEARALNGDGVYFVATVGQLTVRPNATNIVPGRVEMAIELRSDSSDAREFFVGVMRGCIDDLVRETGVGMSFEPVSDADPAACDEVVRTAIRDACEARGIGHLALPSGAGHDAMHVAAAGPIGMIFIPCKDGRSHCPEEWVEPEQLAAGAEVLYETVLRLDERVG